MSLTDLKSVSQFIAQAGVVPGFPHETSGLQRAALCLWMAHRWGLHNMYSEKIWPDLSCDPPVINCLDFERDWKAICDHVRTAKKLRGGMNEVELRCAWFLVQFWQGEVDDKVDRYTWGGNAIRLRDAIKGGNDAAV